MPQYRYFRRRENFKTQPPLTRLRCLILQAQSRVNELFQCLSLVGEVSWLGFGAEQGVNELVDLREGQLLKLCLREEV